MNRRNFILSTTLASGVPMLTNCFGISSPKKVESSSQNISLGLVSGGDNPEEALKKIRDLGFSTCQLSIGNYSPELANRLNESKERYKVSPTTLICHGPGKYLWNFMEGPSTIGLVPREFREARIERLHKGIDFCKEVSIPAVHAHFGFIPENPKDILYIEFIEAMKSVGEYALNKGIDIYFETGQETPVTLLRTIQDIGTGNIFVNYDTANLVMYGKANPLDGLKVIGKYVKELHAKDGNYPTNPYELGKEVPIPEGEVNFPAVISFLKKLDFKGSITIECELAEHNNDYILKTKEYLEKLILNDQVR